HLLRNRVAVDGKRRLRPGQAKGAGQRAVQALIADLAKLAEHLKVAARTGENAARLEQQAIHVAVKADAQSFQLLSYLPVAAGFVEAVFLIDLHAADLPLAAEAGQHRRCVMPM